MPDLCGYFHTGSKTDTLLGINSNGDYDCRSNHEFFVLITRIETLLGENGVEEGDRVLVFAKASLDALAFILACFYRGAIVVPLAPATSAEQYSSAIALHKPALIYCDWNLALHESVRPETGVPVIDCADLMQLRDSAVASAVSSRVLAEKPDNLPALRVQSSGSTGTPKIIEYTHGNLQRFFDHHQLIYDQYFSSEKPEQPLISVFPFSHLAGLAVPLQGIRMGRPVCILEEFEPGILLQLVADTGAHFLALVSSMYPHLLKEKELIERLDLGALEYCICLGESSAPDLLAAISRQFNAQALCAFGLTECLPGLGHHREDLQLGDTPAGSCGRQVFGELMLINRQGEPQKQFGQLCIRNATVFEGHGQDGFDQQGIDQQALQEGWFITRDLFYLDAQGFYFHRGRSDSLFTYHGKTIAPAEIENLVLQHTSVRKACCVPLTDSRNTVVPGLMVEAEGCTEDALMHFMLSRGFTHLVPRKLLITSAIPLIGPGKLDRIACRQTLQKALDVAA